MMTVANVGVQAEHLVPSNLVAKETRHKAHLAVLCNSFVLKF